MEDSIKKQLERLAEEKKKGGDDSELAKMIEKSSESGKAGDSEQEDIKTVSSEEAFGGQSKENRQESGQFDLGKLFEGKPGSQKALEKYRSEIARLIKQKGAKGIEEIAQATKEYFEENAGYAKTKTGKMILGNLEQFRSATDAKIEKNKADQGTESVEEESKKVNTDAPKSIKEFKKYGYEFSLDRNKKYYNNNRTGRDLEISGYDARTGEVGVIFHDHSMIESQEEGNNVLVVDGGKEKSHFERMLFPEFQKMMEDYVLQGSQFDDSLAPKKIESDANKRENIRPGKLYRNEKGETIQIVENNPFSRSKNEYMRGYSRILRLTPVVVEGKKVMKKTIESVKIDDLRVELEEAGYQETESGDGVQNEQVPAAESKEKKAGKVELEPEKTEQIEHDRDKSGEAGNKELNKEKEGSPAEREKQEQTEKQELEAIEEVFIPYAQAYLEELDAFKPEGYREEEVEEIKNLERKRFFRIEGGVLASRMAESGFISKQTMKQAVEYTKAKLEKEPANDQSK